MDLKSKVRSGLKWIAAMKLGGQVISWASTIIVMRVLNPADYGLLAMAAVFVNMMQILAEGGIGLAVIQAAKIGEDQLRQVLGLVIVVNGALFLCLVVLAPSIAAFFDEPRLVTLVVALACPFLVSTVTAVPEALLTREMNFRAQSIVDLSAALTGAVTTLCMALYGYGVWALVVGTLVSSGVRAVGMNVAAPFLRLPNFSVAGAGSLLRFGGYATFSKVLSFVYNQADTFIGGKLLGKELLGIYSVARELASLPNAKLAGMINMISFSAFSRLQQDAESFALHLQRTARVLFLLVLPVGWGMSSVAEELIQVLLGRKWLDAVLPFKILAVAMPLRLVATFINSANLGQGRADIVTWCVVAPAAVMIPGFFLGVHWGVLGLSVAWAGGFVVSFLVILRIALPPAGVRPMTFLASMAPVLGCATVMYAIVTLVRSLLPSEWRAELTLGILVSSGAVAFLGCAMLVAREQVREAYAMVRA